jgi:dCTP deaminase
MILPDSELLTLGSTLIEPFNPKNVQPASYDLALDGTILRPSAHSNMDLRRRNPLDVMQPVKIGDGFTLEPGACILGSTLEVIHCPIDCVARVEGKSSLGRLFMAVHVTAGFVDPGFKGQITLEIVNHGPWGIVLWPGMKIAQINFARMEGPCSRPYGSPGLGSHYQGQVGPTPATGNRDEEAI